MPRKLIVFPPSGEVLDGDQLRVLHQALECLDAAAELNQMGKNARELFRRFSRYLESRATEGLRASVVDRRPSGSALTLPEAA
jgi:hypothetical protein